MKNVCIYITLLICLFSCNKKQNTQEVFHKQQDYYLDSLFNEVVRFDSLEYWNMSKTLFYLKSGYILSDKNKNIVSVSHTNLDSVYIVHLYNITDNRVFVIDSLLIGDILPIQLSLIFDDYNFDGQKDFYIQASVSNGLALSKGYLILLDDSIKNITEYKKAHHLANIRTEPGSKTIFSDSIIWNDGKGRYLCRIRNKWIDNRLVPVDIDYTPDN